MKFHDERKQTNKRLLTYMNKTGITEKSNLSFGWLSLMTSLCNQEDEKILCTHRAICIIYRHETLRALTTIMLLQTAKEYVFITEKKSFNCYVVLSYCFIRGIKHTFALDEVYIQTIHNVLTLS